MSQYIKSTSFLIITAITLLVLALSVRNGAAVDSLAVLKTTGIPCGSCYSKISKALESLKGVEIIEVDEEVGRVIVGFDTKIIKPETLAEKFNDIGFGSYVHVVQIPETFK